MDAVIYARVSRDRGRKARSVEEQIAECTDECARRGWNIVDTITDNDIGASEHTTKKNRPGYQALKKALPKSAVLVAWESSRVTRNPWELEELMPLCADAGVLLCFSGSIYDPSKPSDKLTLRITGATSAHEVDLTVQRVQRAVRHRVAEGRPHGAMPYGYKRQFDPETGKVLAWVIDPDEGAVIKEAVRRMLGGDSLRSICRDLNGYATIRTARGGPEEKRWYPSRLRQMLLSPTYAGLRSHKGVVTGPGTWDALITEDQWRRLGVILEDPGRNTLSGRGTDPVHLLSGIVECGRCGNKKMRHFGPKSLKTPRYTCQVCYVGRRADKVDEMVNEAMIAFLEDPRTLEALSGGDDDGAAEALAERKALQDRLEALRHEYVEGKVSAGSFAGIEETLLSKMEAAEARARAAASNPLLAGLARPDARAMWFGLDLQVRKEAVASALRVIIHPQPAMGRKFDPQYVELSWRE